MKIPQPETRPLPLLMEKKGAVELFEDVSVDALVAEAGPGGQVDDPDAHGGEHENAGDPDVPGDLIALRLRNHEAGAECDQRDEDRAQLFGTGCVGVGMEEPHDEDRRHHDGHSEDGVQRKPERLLAEVTDRFAWRDFEVFVHGLGRVYVAEATLEKSYVD